MNCKHCSSPIPQSNKTGPKPKYCNPQCRRSNWESENPEKLAQQRLKQYQRLKTKTIQKLESLEPKACIVCQNQIDPKAVNRGAEICSRECSILRDTQKRTSEKIRAAKERKRLRQPNYFKDLAQDNRAMRHQRFVESINRSEVYLRDHFCCQLCGKPMLMEAHPPKHSKSDCCETKCFLAPTIDHIIPLANGGWHEMSNVQSAHFICNSKKSNVSETLRT